VLFIAGTFAIGAVTPGYSHVRQTVSELGELGSPGQFAFSVLLCLVATCLIICAIAAARSLRELGCSAIPAGFLVAMAFSCAGVGIFSFPHPLHNVFGMSELIGYQAPLVFAFTWRRDPRAKTLVMLSWIFFALIWGAIALNLSALVAPVWAYVKPVHGLAQRALFVAWFGWCAVLGILLFGQNWRIPPD